MADKVTLEGNITKVTRTSGKALAQVVIAIPAQKSGDIPLDGVRITIEAIQTKLFENEKKEPVRGV